MPLYEYVCDNGHRFELIRKFSDPPLEKCPTCGAPVHKQQSAPAIQFKGSGFYITDYAKKEHVAAAKADKAPSSESTSPSTETKSGSETKSETKTDTKTETKPAATPAKTTSSS